MAILQQQNKDTSYSDSVQVITPSPSLTNGSLLTIVIKNTTTNTISSITGGGVTTWTLIKKQTQSSWQVEIWAGIVTGASANISVTTAAPADLKMSFAEWSGSLTLTGTTNGAGSANNTALSPGSITPTASSSTLILIACSSQGDLSGSMPSGFTQFTGRDFDADFFSFGYQLVGSASGSYTGTWTVGTFSNWAAAIANFEAGGGGGGQIPPISRGIFFA